MLFSGQIFPPPEMPSRTPMYTTFRKALYGAGCTSGCKSEHRFLLQLEVIRVQSIATRNIQKTLLKLVKIHISIHFILFDRNKHHYKNYNSLLKFFDSFLDIHWRWYRPTPVAVGNEISVWSLLRLRTPVRDHLCCFAEPVSSWIFDLRQISDLLLFFNYFTSQNEEIKSDNYFFDVCCVNWNILVRCQGPATSYSTGISLSIENFRNSSLATIIFLFLILA